MSAKRVNTQEGLIALLDPVSHLEQLKATLAQLKLQASSAIIQADLLGLVKEEDTDEVRENRKKHEEAVEDLTRAILYTERVIKKWQVKADRKGQAEMKRGRTLSRRERRENDREVAKLVKAVKDPKDPNE